MLHQSIFFDKSFFLKNQFQSLRVSSFKESILVLFGSYEERTIRFADSSRLALDAF